MKRFLVAAGVSLLVFAALAAAGAQETWRPPEGQEASRAEAAELPAAAASSERAKRFVDALRENKPELGLDFFFPRDVFRRLKAIKDPDRYHRRLLRVYAEDLAAMRRQLKNPESVQFVSFELGRQRRWIPRGKEGNAFPYWAAYKSVVTVKDGEKMRELKMRVMINWGDQWYVTHLTNK